MRKKKFCSLIAFLLFIATYSYGQISTSSDGNVGIGTGPTAEYKLDVNGNGRFKQIDLRNDGTGGRLVFYSSNGNPFHQIYTRSEDATKMVVQTYQYLDLTTASGGDFVFNPYHNVTWRLYQGPGVMTLWGYGNRGEFVTKDVLSGNIGFHTFFSDGKFKHEFLNGNVGIGISNPQSKLAVNGTITATKLKVTQTIAATKVKVIQTDWADYVFEPSYKLPTLKEVEAYIKQYKHLPGIITAKEVEKEGLDVGANQADLLKKVEELTLYVIDLQKQISALKKQVDKKSN